MKTKFDSLDDELQYHSDVIDDLLLKEVIGLADNVLRKNKDTKEFIMGMGSFFFTSKKNVDFNYSLEKEIKELSGGSELWNFIYKYNQQFKITGNPIRFCLNGKIKTNW